MKDSISVLAFFLTLFTIQKVDVESYSLKCPSQGSWKIQAKSKCNSTLKYFCLYDNLRKRYVEGCEGPDWDRKGSKRIFSVSFTRGECTQKRYQPFRFQTNESMSDCIYAKSLCNEEGHIIYKDESSKNDRTCRCDYTRNYSFTITPKHVCYCIPTEEDCSCFIKACQLNFTLSTDYNCNPNGYKENPKCIDTIRDSTTIEEQIEVNTEKNNIIYTEHRWTLAYVMLVLVCFICIFGAIGAFYLATENLHQIPITVLNIAPKWLRKKLQSSERCIGGGQTDTDETGISRTESVKTLETDASYKSTTYDQTHDTDETGISRTESVKTLETDASYISTTYDQTYETDIRRTESTNTLEETFLSCKSTTFDKTHETHETDIRRTESSNTLNGTILSCEDADGTNVVRTELLATVDGNDHGYCKEHVDNGSFKASTEEIKVEMHNTLRLAELTQDDVNYLRMIHLLFRVACPAVRMIFNHEIQPDQLRKTLDKKKAVMKKKYRKKARIINNCQWNLLYGPVTGNTVTSDDFDITIMIHLLVTLTHIEVGDLYPVQSDERLSAMLSRIKYIRNELAQNYKGTLLEDQFNKYWDDIAQAVFKLVYVYGTANDKDVNYQQISRLHMLNLIDLDNDKLCLYIGLSEIYPAKILQQIINEYCMLTEQTVEEILRKEQHDLYHKRILTESCCVCNAIGVEFCTFTKVIPEIQWEILYEMKECNNVHSCPYNSNKCCENFIPKKIDTCDLSVTIPLVLNIPDILMYIINQLYMEKFDTFLINNKHVIYHSMEKTRCCKCVKDPHKKLLINKKEWNKLFMKEDNVSCQTASTDCSCKYSVIKKLDPSKIDEYLLSNIFHVAGPISVLVQILQNRFLYFLNWTVGDSVLQGALEELSNVIDDETFRNNMLQQISSRNPHKLEDTTKRSIASGWISKQLQNQKSTPETSFGIYVFNQDDLTFKHIHIPKDFSLPNRTRHFKDLTDEEINFLLVVYGLTKIVYPAIKDEFDTKCPDHELEKIRMEIYEQQRTMGMKDSHSDKKKNIYLTQKQREQLLSPNMGESRKLDLKLMIYILRRKAEENSEKEYVDHLDVIDDVRREIFQSSSGVLNKWKFQEILKLVSKAIVHIGGEQYDAKIANLHDIRNSLVVDLL